MTKLELIDEFLEKVDLKPHELVFWKHKVSNGFDLKKFMNDFLNYIENNQFFLNGVDSNEVALNEWYAIYSGSEKLDLGNKKVIAYTKYTSHAKELCKKYGRFGYYELVNK